MSRQLNSQELARYIESTNGLSKPWLLVQLRLSKLQEERPSLSPEDYAQRLADIHTDLMALGEWWQGREAEVFGLTPKASNGPAHSDEPSS